MIDAITTRLDTNKASLGLKLISGVADFQAAYETEPLATPAAYVMIAEEIYSPSEATCVIEQQGRIGVAICYAVRNVADVTGAAAGEDLKPLRLAVSNKLLGWVPLAGYAPLERGRCHLLAFRPGGLMYWQDLFYSSYLDRHDLQE